MIRSLLASLALLACMTLTAQAEPLTGEQIRQQVSGARITGINDVGTPYSVWLKRGGTLQGVQGKLGQFDDHGRWWVKDDKLCVQWELWLFAKPTCYGVELEGDQITRIEYGSRTIIRSTLVRDGKMRARS